MIFCLEAPPIIESQVLKMSYYLPLFLFQSSTLSSCIIRILWLTHPSVFVGVFLYDYMIDVLLVISSFHNYMSFLVSWNNFCLKTILHILSMTTSLFAYFCIFVFFILHFYGNLSSYNITMCMDYIFLLLPLVYGHIYN